MGRFAFTNRKPNTHISIVAINKTWKEQIHICMCAYTNLRGSSLTEFVVRTWFATFSHVQHIHINVYVYTYITTYYLVDWNSCVYHFGNRETFNINFYTNANYIYVYHKRNVFNYPLAIQIIKSFDCVGNHIQFFCMKTLLYLIDTDVNPVLWIVNLQLVKLICG